MSLTVENAAQYQSAINQINVWYGTDAQDVINICNQYGVTPSQLVDDFIPTSNFEPWYTSSGSVGGYNSVGTTAVNTATGLEQAVNSNAGSTSQVLLKTPVETAINSQTGNVTMSTGLTSVATGAKSALTFLSTEVLPAVSAAGLGITLGKTIDSALYNANPAFWDNMGMSTLNPETWNSITSDYPDGVLKKAFNTVFGLNPNTGETQMYLDENAAAYLAMYMQENGVFSTGEGSATVKPDATQKNVLRYPTAWYADGIYYGNGTQFSYKPYAEWTQHLKDTLSTSVYACCCLTSSTSATIKYYSETPFTVTHVQVMPDGTERYPSTYNATQATDIAGNTYYTANGDQINIATGQISVPAINQNNWGDAADMAYIILHGAIREQPQPPVAGITDQTGATQPNFSGCETPADYLQALKNQYPDLFNNAVTQTVVNPDGTTKTTTYIPVGTPSKNNGGNKTQPTTDNQNSGNTQTGTTANPSTLDLTGLENLIKTLTDTISQTGTPTNPTNPDPTGTGNTPPVVVPTGSASALWSVYNPTQGQLNSFGAWLWSSNFIDQVLKLFNNPMQSIIGVHKIFATPATSGAGTITVGYLSSGVSANLVSNQYTDIDCGTVKVSEQFGNVFDYTDTQVRLYLPFIGIVDLDVSDVMRGSVKVVYHVDVITGACLAEVKVTRDGSGGTLYQYAGDAAVRYPISSGSYMGVVAGIASAVGGVASAVMTGGATLPLAAGAIAGGMSGAHTQVQHSGNFSGNAGAMGAKKPYLIIERPQTMIADGFEDYQGKGANKRRTVGQMSGYFKFSDVRTDSISGAAESEIEAIRAALESGVIA